MYHSSSDDKYVKDLMAVKLVNKKIDTIMLKLGTPSFAFLKHVYIHGSIYTETL